MPLLVPGESRYSHTLVADRLDEGIAIEMAENWIIFCSRVYCTLFVWLSFELHPLHLDRAELRWVRLRWNELDWVSQEPEDQFLFIFLRDDI